MGRKFFQQILYTERVPLTFTCTSGSGGSVTLNTSGNIDISGVQYRMGMTGVWLPYTSTVAVESMQSVQFQNTASKLSTSTSVYASFSLSGTFEASGNVQSMLNYSTAIPAWGFYRLFFQCYSLVTPPDFRATTLGTHCCHGMFSDCTQLTAAPDLRAVSLGVNCYRYMFYNCLNLSSIKVHFSDWGNDYTLSWMTNVARGGVFYKPSALQEKFGATYIPSGWTVVNID